MRATASPDDESERSEIPPIGETGGSTVFAAGESRGAAASSDDALEMTIRGGDRGNCFKLRRRRWIHHWRLWVSWL